MESKTPSVRSLTSFSRQEIIKSFKSAKLICSNSAFDIKLSPTGDHGKVLIVIPKKVGNAPERNLIRRRIKSIFYEEKLFNFQFNWIFLCKKPIVDIDFSQLKSIILNCSSKIS